MKKKRKILVIKVPGHWVIPDVPGKRAYYVKPYKYKRKSSKGKKHKKHLVVRDYPGKRIPQAPKGYVIDRHYDVSEPEGRVVYTYKIEALVEYQGRYLMSFTMDKDLKGQKALEYYHSKFEPTIEAATLDFHNQMAILNAYGHIITILSIDLYRVAGEGPITTQNWHLIKSYDNLEAIPGA